MVPASEDSFGLTAGRNTAGACDDIGVLQVHYSGDDSVAHDWRPSCQNVVTARDVGRFAAHVGVGQGAWDRAEVAPQAAGASVHRNDR